MAQLIRIQDNRTGYLQLVDFVRTRGRRQASRNGDTLEVDDIMIELADPTKAIPTGISRKGYSLALAALEGLQLVAGITYDDLMVRIAPNTEQFTEEDDHMFHGGYGRRIGWQMPIIVDRIKQDPDTRQAVVTLWDPELDAEGGKKDHPCTCLFNWRVREGKLLMSTFMRSQDVHWGWPYDVVMFCTLQLAMASYLGVECGPYTHHAASFHIYTKDIESLNALRPWDGVDTRLPAISVPGAKSWEDVMVRAQQLVAAGDDRADAGMDPLVGGEQWYVDTLKARLGRA